MKAICNHCGVVITHQSGELWHDGQLVFPQYCRSDSRGAGNLHAPILQLDQNPELVDILESGDVVLVGHREFRVELDNATGIADGIYLTTTDSDMDLGNSWGENYTKHIHHFREPRSERSDLGFAIMSRARMKQLLISKEYHIK